VNVKFIDQQRQITIDQDELIATLDAYFQQEGEEQA
jgi:histidyl-tRNA synthetase